MDGVAPELSLSFLFTHLGFAGVEIALLVAVGLPVKVTFPRVLGADRDLSVRVRIPYGLVSHVDDPQLFHSCSACLRLRLTEAARCSIF